MSIDLEAIKRAREEADVFRASVGQVSQLRDRNRAHHPASKPAPVPVQSQRNDQAVLQASLSDEFDVESLLETDETLSFRRPGIGMDVIYQLKELGSFYPGEAVIIALVLAFVPYLLLRGPVQRVAHWWLNRPPKGAAG